MDGDAALPRHHRHHRITIGRPRLFEHRPRGRIVLDKKVEPAHAGLGDRLKRGGDVEQRVKGTGIAGRHARHG
jgi:hypothetical protein